MMLALALQNAQDGFEFLSWIMGVATFIFVVGTFIQYTDRGENRVLMLISAVIVSIIFLISGFLAASL